MATDLSDKELVKAVRGSTSKRKFAALLGVSRSVIPQYEKGLVRPHTDAWLKMARLTQTSLKVLCWQRAGLDGNEIEILHQALMIEAGGHVSDDLEKKQALLAALGVKTEPVTEPLGNEPVGGEPAALKGASKTVEEFWARNPAVRSNSATGKAVGPLDAETEPPASAKKAKRERRREK